MDEILSEAKTSRGGRVTLRTVLRTRLLFGFYSGISRSAALRFLARIYCICLTCATSFLIFITIPNSPILSSSLLFEYNLKFLIAFFRSKNDVFSFYKKIEQVDEQMGYDHLLLITPGVRNIFLLSIGVNLIHQVLYAFRIDFSFISLIICAAAFIMNTAIHLNIVINVLPLDLVRRRLYLLRHNFKNIFTRVDDTDRQNRNNINHQVKKIFGCLQIYRDLIDNLDATFRWIKLQIAVHYVTSFCYFIVSGRNIILDLKNDNFSSGELTTCANVIIQSVLACLPAVFAELVTREVDNFKITIEDKALECEDEELWDALTLAGDYLELRPFRVTICRVFTLDASLAVSFVSLCTTSLIVVIQITGII